MNTPTRERASALFSAMGHVTRLRIVEALLDSPKTVNEVAATLLLQQSTASQHLQVLARAGVVRAEVEGSSRRYRVRGPRIARIVSLIEDFCNVHGLYGPDGIAEESQDPEPVLQRAGDAAREP